MKMRFMISKKLLMVLMIFFVNIGPELANKIVIPENNDVLQYMNDRNVNSMFLHGVNKKEMLDVIKSFANKTSTDYNGMNMFI